VVKVDSKFDQGQFLQTLTCVRMNNQQGEGTAPNVISSSALKSKYIDKKNDGEKTVSDIKSKALNAKQLVDELKGFLK
jgi:hypothetical protein